MKFFPLHPKVCEQARQTRDARFDGHFFVGVRTTGVYCRPICPVRLPKAENVQFFRTAAGAAEAGFRPCLRCRPESSPGTPAWLGTSVTVSRALKLIAGGALDSGSVEELSATLGIGSRHLSRLFHQHLGASPLAVAQTQRLHFAKKLLDETTLPMVQIGFAAGFGSIRRFNDAFQKAYGQSPGQLRKNRSRSKKNAHTIELHLPFRPPLDGKALLEFLRGRAIPGVECVDATSYQRTIELDGKKGAFAFKFLPERNCLRLAIRFPDSKALFKIVERVRHMADLKADSMEIQRFLSQDSFLAPLVAKSPGLRVPGCWDGFEVAVRAVLGQQITVKAATTLAARLVQVYGEIWPESNNENLCLTFPTPAVLAQNSLIEIGLPQARRQTLRNLATAVCEGKIVFDGSMDSETFVRQITQIHGIGDWTAQYIALRALDEPDAFPASDLGLLKAISPEKKITPRTLLSRAKPWQPWRAYAVMYLWQRYAELQQ